MLRCSWTALLCLVAVSGLTAAAEVDMAPGGVNPSDTCGECHEAIHAMWKRSMHSAAFTDPIFEASYLKAYWETAGEAKRICLPCHAPVAVLTGDLDLQNPVSREGITCDYCHSIESVDLDNPTQPMRISRDGAKRGPLADADSPVHAIVKSALHESAEFCAGCHEYTNAHGVAVLSTYTEWKASPQAAEGKTCQHCHMPLTPGETVRPEVRAISREKINLHNISGMHSSEQVRKAATARILRVNRPQPTRVEIDVEVANVGSGHSIPTGLPTRKLVLEVVLFSGRREVRRFEQVYQKTLVDERGELITADHRAILASRSVRHDNRLLPGERRRERFVSRVPSGGQLHAEMRLRYLYEPLVFADERISIELAHERSGTGP